MKKRKVSKKDILKRGAKLSVVKIDMNDPLVKAAIENVKRRQAEIIERSKIDYRQLQAVITI